jgi:tRNA(Ile)-lysidine synthetase-like protein
MIPRVCGSPCGGGDAMTLCNLPAGAALLVRRRLSGDRFHPPWKEKPVKVKDFLRDQHVPAWERDRLPCVVLDGRVIAIYPKFVARGFDRPAEGGRELCIHFSRS